MKQRKLYPSPTAALQGMRWIFKGAELSGFDPGEKPGSKSTLSLDSSKTPKHFDLTVLKEGAQKGKTMQAIFKLEKGRLIICFRGLEAAKKGRPKDFKTEADSGLGMITLERLKE